MGIDYGMNFENFVQQNENNEYIEPDDDFTRYLEYYQSCPKITP